MHAPSSASREEHIVAALEKLHVALQEIATRLPPAEWNGASLAASRLAVWRGMPTGLMALPLPEDPRGAAMEPIYDASGHYPILCRNLLAFAEGRPANHTLLWGARGMGKSSMVHAACAEMLHRSARETGVIEILQEGLASLPELLVAMVTHPGRRYVLVLDDLAYEDGASPQGYNALKSLLEGSLLTRGDPILVLATSNRRHLVSELAVDQDSARALHSREAMEEKVSLSDRFGLWLGYPACSQEEYLRMVGMHAQAAGIPLPEAALHAQALEWAMTRGGRSGRVAAQFVRSLA